MGILGIKYLMESRVYLSRLEKYGLKQVIPDEEDRLKINNITFKELVYGVIKPNSRNYLVTVIEKLMHNGCDATVLGCNELPPNT